MFAARPKVLIFGREVEDRGVYIEVDERSGFCFGVEYAIELAEKLLEEGRDVYCLGDIVHNDLEMRRLQEKGLKFIGYEEFKKLRNATVLLRAHGEPPETYRIALENNLELIDASCPIVLKLQNRVVETLMRAPGDALVVIYGNPEHPEVKGIAGQLPPERVVVVRGVEDLDRVDFSRPIYIFSQTTKSTAAFREIVEKIVRRARQQGNDRVVVNDTLCRQVSNRDEHLREFASRFDVVVFVAGKKSSNGKSLYGVCKAVNPETYFVSSPDELRREWFVGRKRVGICGATSTPRWLMEEVAHRIRELVFGQAEEVC